MEALTLVVNPMGGGGRTAKMLPRIVEAVAERGMEFDVAVSATPADVGRLAAEAASAGRVAVAVGGDGTVSEVASAVAAHEGRMGIVPAGNGNDAARHFGFDLKDPVAAVDVLRVGEARSVDIAMAGDRRYLTVAGAGFDAEATRWALAQTRLSGTPLYVAAALRTLRHYRPRPFRITVDGTTIERSAWMVATANTAFYGGGMKVAPAASAADGHLDLTIVGAVGRAEFLRTFPKVFKGGHVDHPMVEVLTGREITVECLDGVAPLILDGEDAGDLPVDITVAPGALELVVPGSGRAF